MRIECEIKTDLIVKLSLRTCPRRRGTVGKYINNSFSDYVLQI